MNRETAYRIYVTRSLQLAPEGKSIVIKFSDLLQGKEIEKEEEENGDEIVASIFQRAGLKIGE